MARAVNTYRANRSPEDSTLRRAARRARKVPNTRSYWMQQLIREKVIKTKLFGKLQQIIGRGKKGGKGKIGYGLIRRHQIGGGKWSILTVHRQLAKNNIGQRMRLKNGRYAWPA